MSLQGHPDIDSAVSKPPKKKVHPTTAISSTPHHNHTMAVLGKRKATEPSISEEEANEIFRRHFESRFAPLPETTPSKTTVESDHDDDEPSDSEWGGISSDEDSASETSEVEDDASEAPEEPSIQVIDHSIPQIPKPTLSKSDLKAILSSRPSDPTATPPPSQPTKSKPSKTSMPEDAPSLLKQDLELRRLISESHLFSANRNASVFSATALGATAEPKTFAAGRTRQKATDLRVQALGSKSSILKQDKMPMSMRKGMAAAASARESKRRREAKENGVILERAASGKKNRRDRPRDRAVDAPGMGRFKGAELRLNKNDIKKLEGSRDAFGRRSRR